MLLLQDIIGHEEIVKVLQGAIISGRVAHAHLFSGPKGVGKMTTALAFAQALICAGSVGGDGCGQCSDCEKVGQGIHPQVRSIYPEGSSIKIGQIRELVSGLQFGPEHGRWAVRILEEADTMTPEAGNSLLKTLEEPLPGVIFILITTRPQMILPTILSRCQHRYFQPLAKQQLVKALGGVTSDPRLQQAAALSGGSLGKALGLLSGDFMARDQAILLIKKLNTAGVGEILSLAAEMPSGKDNLLPILDMMILWFRDILLYNETDNLGLLINTDKIEEIRFSARFYSPMRLIGLMEALEDAKNSLAASANIQLALEALFLRLAGYAGTEGEGV